MTDRAAGRTLTDEQIDKAAIEAVKVVVRRPWEMLSFGGKQNWRLAMYAAAPHLQYAQIIQHREAEGVPQFTQYTCLQCGWIGEITESDIAEHRKACRTGTTMAVAPELPTRPAPEAQMAPTSTQKVIHSPGHEDCPGCDENEARLLASDTHQFENFHRNLCERVGYVHDPVDWRRDQASLIEYIAGELKASQEQPAHEPRYSIEQIEEVLLNIWHDYCGNFSSFPHDRAWIDEIRTNLVAQPVRDALERKDTK
jgi:hypothetical protein